MKYVWRSLLVDSRWKLGKATEEIGACMETATGKPDLRGAYTFQKRWYHHASARAPNPSWEDMAKVTGDYIELYRQEEPIEGEKR